MLKRRLAVLILLAALLAGCKAREATITPLVQDAQSALEQAARYEVAECPFGNANFMRVDAHCGYLTVPEDRGEPYGKTIRLATAILKSTAEHPRPDPVVMMFYNPGASLDWAPGFAYLWDELLEERDLVILEQRGTGHSEPAFDCPEVRDEFYNSTSRPQYSPEQIETYREIVAGCARRWQGSELDLSTYTSEATAADLEDLRQALGYEQWNLYAVGYGSYIAFQVMRDYGQGVRSAVIDSSVPGSKEMFLREPANAEAALHVFFELCRADEACDEAYPDLENRFYRLAADYDASPQVLQLKNPQSGERHDFYVNGSVLVQFAYTTLAIANERYTPELPRAIAQAETGDTRSLANMMGELLEIFAPPSSGMQWLVNCKEWLPVANLDERRAAMASVNEQVAGHYEDVYRFFDATCEVFDNLPWPQVRLEPVDSNVPVLSITGSLAAWSSAEWAESAAANLDQVTLVDVNGGTSTGMFGASWQTCSHKLVEEFIHDPNTALDTSCADVPPAIRWITFQQ